MNIHYVAYTGGIDTIDSPKRNGLGSSAQMGCTSIIVSCNGYTDWYAGIEAKMAAGQRVWFKLNGLSGSQTEELVKYWAARPVADMVDGYHVKDEPSVGDKALILEQLHAIHGNTAKPSWLNVTAAHANFETFLKLGTSLNDYAKIFTLDEYPYEGKGATYAKGLWDFTEDGLSVSPMAQWVSAMIQRYIEFPKTKGVTLSPANGHVLGVVIQAYRWLAQGRADAANAHWEMTQAKIENQLKVALGITPYNGSPPGWGTRLDTTVDGSQVLQFVSVYVWNDLGSDRTCLSQSESLTNACRTAAQNIRTNYQIIGTEVYTPGGVAPPAPPPPASGGGLAVDTIKYYPRGSMAARMDGGKFQYSDDGTNWTDVHTISGTPPYAWTTVSGISAGTHRYWRYRAPAASWGNIAELQFWASGTNRTSDGTSFGTAGSFENGGDTYDKVFDGLTGTAFDANQADYAYVGKDFGAVNPPTSQVAAPAAAPPAGSYTSAQDVTLNSATSGADIRYTVDGSTPSDSVGTLYTDKLTGTIKVIPLGDSLTKGEGPADDSTNSGGYRRKLQALLTSAGIGSNFVGSQTTYSTGMSDPQHEGHDGMDTNQLNTDVSSNTRVTTHDPDVIVLMTGVNDIINGDSAATTASDIDTLLTTIWTQKSGVRVMLCEVMPMIAGASYAHPERNGIILDLNARLATIVATRQAAGKSIRLVRTYAALNDAGNKSSLYTDGVHLTRAGYDLLGQTIFDGISPAFATLKPVRVASSLTLKAIAYKSGMSNSNVTSAAYVIGSPSGSPQLNPTGATVERGAELTVRLTNAGGLTIKRVTRTPTNLADIGGLYNDAGTWLAAEYLPNGGATYFTLNANTSTTGTCTYTVTLTDNSTLTFVLIVSSSVVSSPVITPGNGTYASAQTVTLTCVTSDATIRYTLDGTEPTGSSAAYSAPLSVAATTVVKAKAFKGGMTDSPTASATLTIQLPLAGSPTSCRIFPVASYEAQMDGAIIEVSNDAMTWTPLYTISGTPSAGWTTYALSPTAVYRYMRVRAGASKTIRIAELEFYYGATRLTGGAISSPFNGTNYPARAFDGSTSGGYFGAADVGGWIGLDVLAPNNTTPTLSPSSVDMPLDWEQRVTVLNLGALSIKTVSASNALVEIGYVASDWFNANSGGDAGTCDVTVTLSDNSTLTLACRIGLAAVVVAAYRSWPSVT